MFDRKFVCLVFTLVMLFLMSITIIALHAWAIKQPCSANIKDLISNDNALAISRHDNANNKKQQNLMTIPNHLQKK